MCVEYSCCSDLNIVLLFFFSSVMLYTTVKEKALEGLELQGFPKFEVEGAQRCILR